MSSVRKGPGPQYQFQVLPDIPGPRILPGIRRVRSFLLEIPTKTRRNLPAPAGRSVFRYQLVCLLEVFCRDRFIKLPHNVHRFAPLMGYIIRCAKEGIGLSSKTVSFMLPYKKHYFAAKGAVVYVSLSCI